jgi:SAM-dependent methyltransferase
MRGHGGLRALARWVLAFVDAKRLGSLALVPRYIAHWRRYERLSGRRLALKDSYPCLSDWVSATPFDPHYFYQSAWLSRQLQGRPASGPHVDLGSDVRMIASLSAFVRIEFVDFRPLEASLTNLRCVAGNITALSYRDASLDSVSCLHVVEHVGLGRYGDPLQADGSEQALSELARVVAPGGRLYLSVPVGRETVCFNAHRVFDPETIKSAVAPLRLVSFALVTDAGAFVSPAPTALASQQAYGCGMFVFERP